MITAIALSVLFILGDAGKLVLTPQIGAVVYLE